MECEWNKLPKWSHFLSTAPAPSNVQSILATKCFDNQVNKSQFFYVRPTGKGCDKIEDLHGEAEQRHINDKNVVFVFQVFKESHILSLINLNCYHCIFVIVWF